MAFFSLKAQVIPESFHEVFQISLVTLDTTTFKNMVIWQKQPSPYDYESYEITVEHYNIYRQDTAGLPYYKIAQVPYADLSVFVDTTSEPRKRPYKYKLSARVNGTSGMLPNFNEETDTSKCWYHQSLFIKKEVSGDTFKINVDPYEVQGWNMDSVFSGEQVMIYKGTDSTQLSFHDSIDVFFHDSTIIIDDPAIFDSTFYFTFNLSFPMLVDPNEPLPLKANAGPFSQSISNLEDNRLKGSDNHVPTDITISDTTINENSPVGMVVGTLNTLDIDAGDEHTYALVSGTGDTGNDYFSINGENLVSDSVFDFESQNIYSIRVEATETNTADNFTIIKTFTIKINDLGESGSNHAPSGIELSDSTILENQPSGSVVGILDALDIDVVDTHDFTLISGAGDTDNASFIISGDTLKTNTALDYNSQSSYSIRVKATENNTSDNFSIEKVFIIDVESLSNNQDINDLFGGLSIYPNPYNDITNIRYSLKRNAMVNISVYSMLGRKIMTLVNKRQEPGIYNMPFSVNNYGFDNGIYIIVFNADDQVVKNKIFEY